MVEKAAEGSGFEERMKVAEVAYDYFIEGASDEEIRERHGGISAATLSRRLKQARELVREVRSLDLSPDEEVALYERVTLTKVAARLRDRLNSLGAGLRSVVVVRGDSNPSSDQSYETPDTPVNRYIRINRVGRHAARLIAQDLKTLMSNDSEVRIAVNYGYSVRWACRHLAPLLAENLRESNRLALTALSGLFWPPTEKPWAAAEKDFHVCSANSNAELLASSLREPGAATIHRMRVPAFVHESVQGNDNAQNVMQAFFNRDPGYRCVFGQRPVFPINLQVREYLDKRREEFDALPDTDPDELHYGSLLRNHIIITGLSALQREAGVLKFAEETLQSQVEDAVKGGQVVGDLCNHMFDKEGYVSRDENSVIGRANRGMVGLFPEDLTEFSALNRANSAGGVVLVCGGIKKAQALFIALTKFRAANAVVMDSNAAYGLYDLCGIKNERRDDFASLQAQHRGGSGGVVSVRVAEPTPKRAQARRKREDER